MKLMDGFMRLMNEIAWLMTSVMKLMDGFMRLMDGLMRLMDGLMRLMDGVVSHAETAVDLVNGPVRLLGGVVRVVKVAAGLTVGVVSHTDKTASQMAGVVRLLIAFAWLTARIEGFAGVVMMLTGLFRPPRPRSREGSAPPACSSAMARRAMGYLLLLFTLALVGCDHATKAAAQAALGHRGPVALVPGVLDLHYAENRDTAFSLLRGMAVPHKGALLVAASAVGLLAVAFAWWRRRRASGVEQAAFALLLAGAAGNAIDRVRAGYVVDFIEIHRWPIFNVADVAIVAGVALLLISGLRRRSEAPPGVIR